MGKGYNKWFDALTIGHFLLYLVIGVVYPGRYWFALLLGVLWEILEYAVTSSPRMRPLLERYHVVPRRVWDENAFNKNRFWDIVANMLGYWAGSSVPARYFHVAR